MKRGASPLYNEKIKKLKRNDEISSSHDYSKLLCALNLTNDHLNFTPCNRGVGFYLLHQLSDEFTRIHQIHLFKRGGNNYKTLDELLSNYKEAFKTTFDQNQEILSELDLENKTLLPFLKSFIANIIGELIVKNFKLNSDLKKTPAVEALTRKIAQGINFRSGNCIVFSALFFYHLKILNFKNATLAYFMKRKFNGRSVGHEIIIIGDCRPNQTLSSFVDKDCIIVDFWSGKIYPSRYLPFDTVFWKNYKSSIINIQASTNDPIDFEILRLQKDEHEKIRQFIDESAEDCLRDIPPASDQYIDESIPIIAEESGGSFDLDDVLDEERAHFLEKSKQYLAANVILFSWRQYRRSRQLTDSQSPSFEKQETMSPVAPIC